MFSRSSSLISMIFYPASLISMSQCSFPIILMPSCLAYLIFLLVQLVCLISISSCPAYLITKSPRPISVISIISSSSLHHFHVSLLMLHYFHVSAFGFSHSYISLPFSSISICPHSAFFISDSLLSVGSERLLLLLYEFY